MATYNRGRHILPSIRSVEQQSLSELELIVVGDHCTDDTAEIVQTHPFRKVRWLNLEARCGSQSFPNNAGIAAARGEFIAYIGHDDIWAPDHLQSLLGVFLADPATGIAVSGAIFHFPNGMAGSQVTGLFDSDEAKFTHFFPPSSFAHRKELTAAIGPWRAPGEIRPPVDAELLLRAAEAGTRFASTGRVTVHKFAAGHRYLSYVRHESHEQAAMLERMARPDFDREVADIVEAAKSGGSHMVVVYRDFSGLEPGQLARENRWRKGVERPPLLPLGKARKIEQRDEPCALDWDDEPEDGIRWHLRNPRPRFLIPFTTDRTVKLSILLAHSDKGALRSLALKCNGVPLAMRVGEPRQLEAIWVATATAKTRLLKDDYTILEFDLAEEQTTRPGRRGLGIGDISLEARRRFGWRDALAAFFGHSRRSRSAA